MTPSQAAQEKPTSPRTEAERDLCDVLYHSEFHISREQADISGRLMYDAMLARGYRIEREAAAATPSLDTRCPQTAGRCEKDAGHEGDHYTEYKEPVWSWMVGAATPSLDVERLARAIASAAGGTSVPLERDRVSARAIAAEYARLDEGSATPDQTNDYGSDPFVIENRPWPSATPDQGKGEPR